MTTVRVTIELPAAEAWFLADVAEQAGLDLATWIRRAVTAGYGKTLSTRDRVKLLHSAGMTDGEMSVRLRMSRLSVATYRRELGLPPRKRHAREKTSSD